MLANICNITAWVLCAAVGASLAGDFIRAELSAAKERKKEAAFSE